MSYTMKLYKKENLEQNYLLNNWNKIIYFIEIYNFKNS